MKKLFSIFLLLAAASLAAMRAEAQVVVIANTSVKSADISKDDLRDVFTGNATTLKDGTRVVPILLKAGTAHEEFLQVYIGKNDAAYRAGWRSLVFSGQAAMPKTLDGDAEAVAFVSHNAGAIGYISSATPHEGVKVLSVR
jgi:ABC-type phosphate transport system substrate-binding protein